MWKVFLAPLFIGLGLLISCDDSQKEKSIEGYKAAEIVNNPASASNPIEEEKPEGGLPEISFTEKEHAFGKVFEGQVVKHTFKFKNTGSAPLLIQNARASCGCTVPSWPKEPIAVGEEGEIYVEFNSKGKRGNQRKTVTITANTDPNVSTLVIAGEVLEGAPDGPVNN